MTYNHELTIALLRACGIPHENVRTVEYFQEANGISEITVTYLIQNADPDIAEIVTQVWEMVREARRG